MCAMVILAAGGMAPSAEVRTLGIMEASGLANRCARCGIRKQAVCGALSDKELEALNAVARRRLVKAGDVILNAEDDASSFANIVSGVVKLSKLLSDGRQQIVGLQFSPDFLGRAHRKRNPFFAEAATDVELCVFPRSNFERLLSEQPELETRLFKETLDELDAARDWMLLLGRKTAAEKVATFIAMIARRQTPDGCSALGELGATVFTLPLTRAEIADYLGLTIETVSRQIGKLKADGLIDIGPNRSIAVLDSKRLNDIARS